MEDTDPKQTHGRAWAVEMARGDMEMGEIGGGLRTEDRGRTSIEVRIKLDSILREEILGRIRGAPIVGTIRREIFAQDLGDNSQYAGEYHRTDNRAGADANRGGYNTGPRGDDIERGGASKRRMTNREDWQAENDLRNKIIRNQDERGRPDFYRSDKIEGGWDYRGKGEGTTQIFIVSTVTNQATIRKTAKTLLIVTTAEKMVIKVPCA